MTTQAQNFRKLNKQKAGFIFSGSLKLVYPIIMIAAIAKVAFM